MLTLLFLLLNWVGWVMGSPSLTHSGPPELDDMVTDAIVLWGEQSAITDAGPGPAIQVQWISQSDPRWSYGWVETYPSPTRPNTWDYCIIGIGENGAPAWLLPGLVAHELGHCLGFSHDAPEPSVMGGSNLGVQPYDMWAAAQIYGPRTFAHRVIVPGITH